MHEVSLDEQAYVAFELASDVRHEFVDGVVRAMTGASIRHNAVAGNLFVELRALAMGTPCRVFIEGVRLRVSAKRHYYPDVMVTCEELTDTHAAAAPCLVAEVLSPSTTAIDRGEKRLLYFAMPSLRHVLLIDHEGGIVEHMTRATPEDPWTIHVLQAGGHLHVDCPAVGTIAVDDVFAD